MIQSNTMLSQTHRNLIALSVCLLASIDATPAADKSESANLNHQSNLKTTSSAVHDYIRRAKEHDSTGSDSDAIFVGAGGLRHRTGETVLAFDKEFHSELAQSNTCETSVGSDGSDSGSKISVSSTVLPRSMSPVTVTV